jgi:hypothetical protein
MVASVVVDSLPTDGPTIRGHLIMTKMFTTRFSSLVDSDRSHIAR